MKDETIIAGTLTKDDQKEVTIKDLVNGEETTYSRTNIAQMTRPVSTMPPMIGILSKTEIRDLVAYLASLKAK